MRLQDTASGEQSLLNSGMSSIAAHRFQSEPVKRSKARSSSNPDKVQVQVQVQVGKEIYLLYKTRRQEKKLVMFTVV